MDKIEKFLKKVSKKELAKIRLIILQILQKDFSDLDIKKLKGEKNKFRVRTGKVRIIFMFKKNKIALLKIVKRDSKTYSKH